MKGMQINPQNVRLAACTASCAPNYSYLRAILPYNDRLDIILSEA